MNGPVNDTAAGTSNVVDFASYAEARQELRASAQQPETGRRWPKSLFPPGQHPEDAAPAPKLASKRASKCPRSAAEDDKKALIRSLIWEISAMMQDPNCPLRGGRA